MIKSFFVGLVAAYFAFIGAFAGNAPVSDQRQSSSPPIIVQSSSTSVDIHATSTAFASIPLTQEVVEKPPVLEKSTVLPPPKPKPSLKETAPVLPMTSSVINTSIATQSTKPSITSFTASPPSALPGDVVTFSWSAQNAVSCAGPMTDPSSLAIPFTGHLPESSRNVVMPEFSADASNITYWIVCADKDWNTVSAKTTIQLEGPHLVGSPYADKNGNVRSVFVTFKGAAAAHVTCINENYASPNPPNFVDSIIVADRTTFSATVDIPEFVLSGTPLACTIDFGTTQDTFTTSGVSAKFKVNTPPL